MSNRSDIGRQETVTYGISVLIHGSGMTWGDSGADALSSEAYKETCDERTTVDTTIRHTRQGQMSAALNSVGPVICDWTVVLH